MRELLHLFYPRYCAACLQSLSISENLICNVCHTSLPFTGDVLNAQTAAAQVFRGRISLSGAAAFLYFDKGTRVQQLIHQVKYKDGKKLARHLGYLLGKSIFSKALPSEILLVPVPLHLKKYKIRRYNQSEEIAKGIAAATGWPLESSALIKLKHTETQTNKGRGERWENVSGSFALKEPGMVYGKNIMIVDDVLTTGATLEACADILAEVGAAEIYITTLACALRF